MCRDPRPFSLRASRAFRASSSSAPRACRICPPIRFDLTHLFCCLATLLANHAELVLKNLNGMGDVFKDLVKRVCAFFLFCSFPKSG